MFDLSLAELGVIGVVALLVLGPERLPKAARTLGFYVRKARQSWYAVKADIERELAADELKRSVRAQADAVAAPVRALQRDLDSVGEELAGTPRAGNAAGAPSVGHAVPGAAAGAAPAAVAGVIDSGDPLGDHFGGAAPATGVQAQGQADGNAAVAGQAASPAGDRPGPGHPGSDAPGADAPAAGGSAGEPGADRPDAGADGDRNR